MFPSLLIGVLWKSLLDHGTGFVGFEVSVGWRENLLYSLIKTFSTRILARPRSTSGDNCDTTVHTKKCTVSGREKHLKWVLNAEETNFKTVYQRIGDMTELFQAPNTTGEQGDGGDGVDGDAGDAVENHGGDTAGMEGSSIVTPFKRP